MTRKSKPKKPPRKWKPPVMRDAKIKKTTTDVHHIAAPIRVRDVRPDEPTPIGHCNHQPHVGMAEFFKRVVYKGKGEST